MRPLLVALSFALSTPAFAEDGVTPTDAARQNDASIDRGLVTTHAETIGEGKWAINAYELIFLGVTYGFTDTIQASLSTLLPIVEDIPLVLALQPKFVLMRTADTVLSLRTPLTFTSSDGETAFTFGAGVVLDQRLDDAGRFALHAGLLATGVAGSIVSLGDDVDVAEGAVLELDVGVTLGVASMVKIIVELQGFAAISDAGFEVVDAALLNYGVRFHGGSLAGDIGFIRPIGVDSDLILGVPYLAFSARF